MKSIKILGPVNLTGKIHVDFKGRDGKDFNFLKDKIWFSVFLNGADLHGIPNMKFNCTKISTGHIGTDIFRWKVPYSKYKSAFFVLESNSLTQERLNPIDCVAFPLAET